MLKITKGLNPLCGVITTYTDDRGNEYVRVRTEDEDFGIAAHDYAEDVNGRFEDKFKWDDAVYLMEQEGLTMLTLKQVAIYKEYLTEINNKLKEIGGDSLKDDWYWTSKIYNKRNDLGWIYWGSRGITNYGAHTNDFRIRPILNLK